MGIFDSLFGKRKKAESSETSVIWNIPISSNENDYVRRCLEAEFQEEKEVRTFRSDAAFATVLTPLNSKEYAKAIKVGKQILPQFSDFDLAYTWLASAYRETNQIQNSKEILSEGLKKAKRKYFILTEMGETEWKSGNIDAALYWWSQALHCLSNNPLDYNAYLLLSYVAKGAGTEEVEKVLLSRVDAMRGGQIRLDSQTAERLTTLVKSKKSETMKKVLYGLHEKYFSVDMENLISVHDIDGVIRALLNYDRPKIREEAAKILGEWKEPCSVQPLIKALQDRNEAVRWQVMKSLGKLNDLSAVAPLITISENDPDSAMRFNALLNLHRLIFKEEPPKTIIGEYILEKAKEIARNG